MALMQKNRAGRIAKTIAEAFLFCATMAFFLSRIVYELSHPLATASCHGVTLIVNAEP